MSKIKLEVADNLDFEEGDCAITIKKDGTIGKVIMPKMNTETLNTEGYKMLLEVVELFYSRDPKQNFSSTTKKKKGAYINA